MAKNKSLTEEEIISSLPNQSTETLLAISKECAKILSEQEKETEQQIELAKTKLSLIRGKQNQ